MILSAIGDCGKKLNRNIHIEKNEYAQIGKSMRKLEIRCENVETGKCENGGKFVMYFHRLCWDYRVSAPE
jgi:hypothetical protein